MSNEPVAWGMPRPDGQIVDVITPEEHARVEGGYTVPLYTHPVDDTALLRQALDCFENHVMQRTYAGGVVICNTAIALRERLDGDRALFDAALLAPEPGQLKDRGTK